MEAIVKAPKPPVSIGLAMMEPLTERGEGYYDIPALQSNVGDKVLNENEKSLKKGVAPMAGTDRIRRLRRSLLPDRFYAGKSGRRHLGDGVPRQ